MKVNMKHHKNKKFNPHRFWFLAVAVIFVLLINVEPVPAQNRRLLKDGKSIYAAEKMLSARGYWISKVDRVWDSSTYHAVTAFQKVEGRKRNGRLTVGEINAIRRSKRPEPVYRGVAHIEVDLKRQVLFLVNDNDVITHILPVSTGNGKPYYQDGKRHIAYTPRGIFKITRQIKVIRRAPLGTLYHPNYFYQGVAIHGSGSIPFYPASHGCIRIPRFASKGLSNLVSVGLAVVIYENADQVNMLIEGDKERQNIPGIGINTDDYHKH